MSKSNQRIIVIERDVLFGEDYFEGFREAGEVDYESRILLNYWIMRRGSSSEPKNHPDGNAELDTRFKQPIAYSVVFNPELRRVFAYQRSSESKKYGEKRLQGKWSWGFGGHIEPSDAENRNFIRESMSRELREEIDIKGSVSDTKVLGYINSDNNSVGKVHFGILYIVSTDAEKIVPLDAEISRTELLSLGELENLCSPPGNLVESWSLIAFESLRKIL